MALAVECFGKVQPERMELVGREFQRSAKKISREDFCEQLCRILAQQFPDETVEKISTAAGLEHSLSRIYARGISRKGSIRLRLPCGSGRRDFPCDRKQLNVSLTLARARPSNRGQGPDFVLAPDSLRGNGDEQIQRAEPCANGNVNTWLVPHRECRSSIRSRRHFTLCNDGCNHQLSLSGTEECSRRSGGELEARLSSNRAPVKPCAHFSALFGLDSSCLLHESQ
jgi:hypothetical protein